MPKPMKPSLPKTFSAALERIEELLFEAMDIANQLPQFRQEAQERRNRLVAGANAHLDRIANFDVDGLLHAISEAHGIALYGDEDAQETAALDRRAERGAHDAELAHLQRERADLLRANGIDPDAPPA